MPDDNSTASQNLQLWFSRVGENTRAAENKVLNWLSQSELTRLQRFRPERKRREYLLSRALMRHALSQYRQRPEAEWQFTEQTGFPPSISDLPAGTGLSLSHSHGYLCFALANCPLGVDIEVVNPDRDLLASARVFMDAAEYQQLQEANSAATDFFYRAWCAKEACYKSLTPEQQTDTTMQSISYPALRAGREKRCLIEGESAQFRFAVAMEHSPAKIKQEGFLATVSVKLELPRQD